MPVAPTPGRREVIGRGVAMGPYFTDVGPGRGVVRYGVPGDRAGVLADPDSVPIGEAACAGRNGLGLSLWRLTVGGAELPGHWFIIGREFVPAPR